MDAYTKFFVLFGVLLLVIFLALVLIYYVASLLILIPIYLLGLIVSIFYFKMAKNAGCRNAWIAFLPFGKNFLAFALPHREYRIVFFKTKHRKIIFWISLIAELIAGFNTGYIAAILYHIILICKPDSGNLFNMNLISVQLWDSPIFLGLFYILLLSGSVVFVLRSIIHGRKNYDLLKTYGYEQFAVWGALLNVICPLVMLIMPVLMADRTPDYGMKNYYLRK